jgi:hypothetical protein
MNLGEKSLSPVFKSYLAEFYLTISCFFLMIEVYSSFLFRKLRKSV